MASGWHVVKPTKQLVMKLDLKLKFVTMTSEIYSKASTACEVGGNIRFVRSHRGNWVSML